MFYKLLPTAYSIWTVYLWDGANYVWHNGTKFIMSPLLGKPVKIDGGSEVYPLGFAYAGRPIYPNIAGYSYLWGSGSAGYINNVLGYGKREVDYGVDEDPRWGVDAFYSGGSADLTGTYVPGGSLKNSSPASIVVTPGQVIGWESNTKIGVYTPISGSGLSVNKYAGYRVLTNGTVNFTEASTLYISQPYFISTNFTIWFDGTIWILSPSAGNKIEPYWEGSSDMLGVYAIVGSGTPASHTITLDSYVEGNVSTRFAQCQVATWL